MNTILSIGLLENLFNNMTKLKPKTKVSNNHHTRQDRRAANTALNHLVCMVDIAVSKTELTVTSTSSIKKREVVI